jgi:hypothetical protein
MSGRVIKSNISRILSICLIFSIFVPISAASEKVTPAPLVTCVNLTNNVERISLTGSCIAFREAPVNWRLDQQDRVLTDKTEYKTITVCASSGDSKLKYRVIRQKCGKYQESTSYTRTVTKPAQPVIAETKLDNESQVSLKLEESPIKNLDAPIAFYTIKLSDGTSRKISSQSDLNLAIRDLKEDKNYTFTVSATSADGTSVISKVSAPVKTPVRVAPPVRSTESVGTNSIPQSPAISLSALAETVTANVMATGFTVNSTGGAVDSYSISPSAPAGMTFNTSTGSFTGTPTTNASATTFTVTATNAGGSATVTFVLTVIAAIPDTVISVAAIGGVTRPVTGATPVTTVTSANGYTGTVTWSGSPSTFAVGTIYTATITLTAASGYTLTGVTANFFTVSNATSVTHSANSGVITAVFPATVAGTATKAVIQTQPSGAVNGVVFTTQPVVLITDSGGNTVTSFNGNVVASRVSGATATLGGTLTVAAVAGVATFTNLYLQGTIGNNNFLRFTPTGLTAANSDTITVTLGAPTKAVLTRAASSIVSSGTAFLTQPQIAIQDIGSNVVTTSSSVVTATVRAGGTIVGRDTATATSGVATFANLGISGNGGETYTVTYTVSGLTTTSSTSYIPQFCDGQSFNCVVGDTGPGGGKIFYVNLGGFTCGPTRTSSCKYLEAAPSGWNTGSDPLGTWAQSPYQTTTVANLSTPETATSQAIGWGYWNTTAAYNQGNVTSASSAVARAYNYTTSPFGTAVDDWYLPSYQELLQMSGSTGQFVGLVRDTYLSSSESSATFTVNVAFGTTWGAQPQSDEKLRPRYIRPIRSF